MNNHGFFKRMIWIQGFILLLICITNWMLIPQFQWFRSSSSASFPYDSTWFQKKKLVQNRKIPIFSVWSYVFPTCQVRVVRFYQSCCPPPHPPPSLPPPPPPPVSPRPCCTNFHLHFRLANSSPSSSPTSELSAHCWTSTWDLPSSVRTAGPQPGTFPAQCAPLDLNGQIECQKICQIKCHKICQIEC